jgi:hypothetical protein
VDVKKVNNDGLGLARLQEALRSSQSEVMSMHAAPTACAYSAFAQFGQQKRGNFHELASLALGFL